MKTFILICALFLTSCAPISAHLSPPDLMPYEYRAWGNCLDKAIWTAEHFKSAPTYILIGRTYKGGLHAQAVWMLGDTYITIDDYNRITEVYGCYTVQQIKEMKEKT